MGRNTLDAFGQKTGGCRTADVAEAEHTDHPLALIDHGQPSDLEDVNRYVGSIPGMPEAVGRQAVLTAEAIQARKNAP